MSQEANALQTKTKVCYSLTETGLLIISFIFSSQYLYFMTDILGIAPALAGIMFLITRIWDAANDPMMGILADRNHSRFGQYRPFILIGGIPLLFSLVLSFTDFGVSTTTSFVLACIFYTLFGMSYTCIFIPYTAMVGNLATTPKERSSLSSMKGAFQAGGVLIASTTLVPLVKKLGGADELNAKGFQLVAIIFAAVALVLFLITFFTVKERHQTENTAKPYKLSIRTLVDIVLKNRNLVLIAVMYFLIYLRMFLNNSTVNYFFIYHRGEPGLISIFMMMISGFNIVCALFAPRLAVKFGKRKLTLVGMVICFLAYVGLYFARLAPTNVFFALTIIVALTGALPYLLIWGFVADVADETEKKKGFRADGLLYSTISFMNKMGAAVAGAVSGFLLDATGYVADVPQTASALAGIDTLMFIIPAACMGLVIICMALYKLD